MASYECWYTVRITDEDDQPISDAVHGVLVSELRNVSEQAEQVIDDFGCASCGSEWDFDDDLSDISKRHPQFIWRISGEGPEDKEYWASWYIAGECIKEWSLSYEIPPFKSLVEPKPQIQDAEEFGREISSLVDSAYQKWQEIMERMPADTTRIASTNSYNWGSWNRKIDSLAELCGRIYDTLQHKGPQDRGSMIKKLRKVLGYSYP